MILLKPEDWIGKEFPLFARFAATEGSEVLRQGTWNILIVQPVCEDCKEMMAELEEKKAERIALVVVPSRPNDRVPDTPFPTFWLDSENSWFVSTPCVVTISGGICMKIGNQVGE